MVMKSLPSTLSVVSLVACLSISLASVSPNLFVQLVAGTSSTGYGGDNGPATSAQLNGGMVWVDTNGNCFVPDSANRRIRKIDHPTGIISTFGGTGTLSTAGASGPIGSTSLGSPWSVVGDTAGSFLYVSDNYNVWKYSYSTNIISVIASQLSGPTGLWLTTADDLYISEESGNRVRLLSSENIMTIIAGTGSLGFSGDSGPAISATFKNPMGIYVDSNGKIYVADRYNYRIRMIQYTNRTITTFAGTGADSFNSDNIPATTANINQPFDVKGDQLGNVYIADRFNCRIRVVDNSGIISTLFGSGTCGFVSGIAPLNSNFGSMLGIWIDTKSNIYFSDPNSVHRSVILVPTSQPSGQPSRQPTTQPSSRPSGQPSSKPSVHTRSFSNVFVRLVAGTNTAGYSGDNGAATLAQVRAVMPWVDSTGNVYIPDYNNFRIRRVDAFGIITTFGGTGNQVFTGSGGPIGAVGFGNPWSIVGDSGGTVFYLSDNSYVWKYVFLSGTIFVYAGGGGFGFSGDFGSAVSARLHQPMGIWLTTSDDLYIADCHNHRVRKVSSSGTISTVAGSGAAGVGAGSFTGDNGPATSATLNTLYGVYMNTIGQLFIADTNNLRVRLVDTSNIITTLVGNGGTTYNGDQIDATSAVVNAPTDMKGDTVGNLFIADSNDLIRMVDTRGIIHTILGTPGCGGFVGGTILNPATSCFNQPLGIWIDSQSSIYFSDGNSVHKTVLVSSPTSQPTSQPLLQPTGEPSFQPSRQPSVQPSAQPSNRPTSQPSIQPIPHPTTQPTLQPSTQPSSQPTSYPTSQPSVWPTSQPSRQPSSQPSTQPSMQPSRRPTQQPSGQPTGQPAGQPTSQPSRQPSTQPTLQPSGQPTSEPTLRLKNGLVAYYTFDVGNLEDETGNGNNGVIQGGVNFVADRFGNANSAVSFNGVNGYVEIDGTQFNFAYNMSVSMWVLPSATNGQYASILGKSQPGSYSGWIVWGSDNLNRYHFEYWIPSSSVVSSSIALSSSNWNHLVIIRKAPYFIGYLNGVLQFSYSGNPVTITANAANLRIGSHGGTQNFWAGIIDDLFIFDRPITALEVQQLYAFDAPTSQPSVFPSSHPSSQPSGRPSSKPSVQPTVQPSSQPIGTPSMQPTQRPSTRPTEKPSGQPSRIPSSQPTSWPSSQPSHQPTSQPSLQPAGKPSMQPTIAPSSQPSRIPTLQPFSSPSGQPSRQPSNQPTRQPSTKPTVQPSTSPSSRPTFQPTNVPSGQPSRQPSNQPTRQPSTKPTVQPSTSPSSRPTLQPSAPPSRQPSTQPSHQPFSLPTAQPSASPSAQPSKDPSKQPTAQPSILPSSRPTSQPLSRPSRLPSTQPSNRPSTFPTALPTAQPTVGPSRQPVTEPTCSPSNRPNSLPSTQPSQQPSRQPSTKPSVLPSVLPTTNPTILPSSQPGAQPSGQPSCQPISLPSLYPTQIPSSHPTNRPVVQPTSYPTTKPSYNPRGTPSFCPTSQPSEFPSSVTVCSPTAHPSNIPSAVPTVEPSATPTTPPSSVPSSQQLASPSSQPTHRPSTQPSHFPTDIPSRYPTSQSASQPTLLPSCGPTCLPTDHPTEIPAAQPIFHPLPRPSNEPTVDPSSQPTIIIDTRQPTSPPSCCPSYLPNTVISPQPSSYTTSRPSSYPSQPPSCYPISNPVMQPTCSPTSQPTGKPSTQPSQQPFIQPSCQPTCEPSSQPSFSPSTQPSSSPVSSFTTMIPTIITERSTPLLTSASPIHNSTHQPTALPSTRTTTNHPSFRPISPSAPTISVFPSGNMNFQISLFIFGSYLPVVESFPNIYLTEDVVGSSYIIFGFHEKERRPKEIIIGARNSQGLYSPVVKEDKAGLVQDKAMSRTALPIGDFNGDTFEDLLICDPLNSSCFVYLGDRKGLQKLQVSFAIKSNNSNLFGWSVAKLNDANKDTFYDIAISALSSNLIYVIFGSNSLASDINIDQLDSSVGIKIIGSQHDQSSGLSLSSAGDFNSDGYSDILLSAIQINPYQNVIYILFLHPSTTKQNIMIDSLTPNKDYFRIIAPLFSFAGFSLSNLGDINQDGFDDIIIGSIPYSGRYLTQKSYVIYGRNSTNVMLLTEMNEDDGFTITGGGFMVAGPGDVNGDEIPDIMICSNQQWQGKGNSYIMVYPHNVTSPPTFLPSAQPSSMPSHSPTSLPSLVVHAPTNTPTFDETMNEPVSKGTFPPFLEATQLPSLAPKTSKPTRSPSGKSTTHFPASPTRKPTANPTKNPTILPRTMLPSIASTERNTPCTYPTSTPSVTPTVSLSTPFQEVTIDREGVYYAPKGNANYIISGAGLFEITSNGGGKKIYTILPSKNKVTINDFNKKYDQISLIHFPYLYSINDLVYRTNPLQLFLSTDQKLILSSMEATELTDDNFIFQTVKEDQKKKTNFRLDLSAVVSLGILIGCISLFGCVTKLNEGEKDHSPVEVEKASHPTSVVVERPDVKNELEKVSCESDSLLISSSESDLENGDSYSVNEADSELSRNDWDALNYVIHNSGRLPSLGSIFSSEDNGKLSIETSESNIEFVLENDFNFIRELLEGNVQKEDEEDRLETASLFSVFDVIDPEEEEEDHIPH
jgi:hypothetical protein